MPLLLKSESEILGVLALSASGKDKLITRSSTILRWDITDSESKVPPAETPELSQVPFSKPEIGQKTA